MAVIRNPRLHSARWTRNAVLDALKIMGEPVIILSMFEPFSDSDAPRCPYCYDDIYKDTRSSDCEHCYGTTFEGGVKRAVLTLGIVGDASDTEVAGKRGWNEPAPRAFTCANDPLISDFDHVIRLTHNDDSGTTSAFEYLSIKGVSRTSLRDGMRAGDLTTNVDASDVVQQTSQLIAIDENHPIRKWKPTSRSIDADSLFPQLARVERSLL